jgi:putative spermidine/putrescine transport system substrate-binding protein
MKKQNCHGEFAFAKKMNRREFLQKGAKIGIAASALGSSSFLNIPPARAEKPLKGTGQVVVCTWGGSFQDAQRETIFKPFTKETGITVVETGSPSGAKIKAQVDSGNMEWDVVIVMGMSVKVVGEKYFEQIDYSYFRDSDYKGIQEDVKRPQSCGNYFFSYVMAYNEKKYPTGTHPKSWKDFVDFQRFPGKRVFRSPLGGGFVFPDIAQLGVGVPRDKVYPPDIKKVWAFYDKLKPHVIKWWTQGAEAPRLLADGEVDIGMGYSQRIQGLTDQGLHIRIEWNEGLLVDDCWVVLKGAKNLTNAMKFIAFASRAEVQAAFANLVPYGPANLNAIDLVKPEIRSKLTTTPENFKKQLMGNWDWYTAKTLDPTGKKTNREVLDDEWQAWVLK